MGIDPRRFFICSGRIRWPHTHGDRPFTNATEKNKKTVAPYTWG